MTPLGTFIFMAFLVVAVSSFPTVDDQQLDDSSNSEDAGQDLRDAVINGNQERMDSFLNNAVPGIDNIVKDTLSEIVHNDNNPPGAPNTPVFQTRTLETTTAGRTGPTAVVSTTKGLGTAVSTNSSNTPIAAVMSTSKGLEAKVSVALVSFERTTYPTDELPSQATESTTEPFVIFEGIGQRHVRPMPRRTTKEVTDEPVTMKAKETPTEIIPKNIMPGNGTPVTSSQALPKKAFNEALFSGSGSKSKHLRRIPSEARLN